MQSLSAVLLQYRRALSWTAGILLTYSVLGFFLLPWVVEKQLIKLLQDRLAVQAQIEKVRFNPFTFTFSIAGFNAVQADGSPLLSWSQVFINAEPSSLFLLRYRLAEISISDLSVYFDRYSTTENTITHLLQQWQTTAAPLTDSDTATDLAPQASASTIEAAKATLPPVEIGLFKFSNGKLHYSDAVPASKFVTEINPINFDINNFSTLENREGAESITISLEENATLTWQGTFSISPLQGKGQIALNKFSLKTPYRYLQDSLPFTLDQGLLSVAFAYDFALSDKGLSVDLSNTNVDLTQLALTERSTEQHFLSADAISLKNGRIRFPEATVNFAALNMVALQTQTELSKTGELNWLRLLASLPKSETPTPNTEATPWAVSIDSIALQKAKVGLTDHQPSQAMAVAGELNSTLQGFSLLPNTKMPLTANLQLASGGELALQGELQLSPSFALQATTTATGLALPVVEPYLTNVAKLTIKDGVLDVHATLTSNSEEAFAFAGNVALKNLNLQDQQKAETFLAFDNLQIGKVAYSLAKQQLDIASIQLDALQSRVLIHKDGTSNIGDIFSSNTTQEASTQAAAKAPDAEPTQAERNSKPFNINIGEIRINDSQSHFTDENLPIVFDTRMQKLNGTVSGFATNSSQPISLGLEGQIDEFGLVQIKGKLNPFALMQQTTVNLQFTNLNMPAMSPYVIKFAGRKVAEGRIDVALNYAINKEQLQATNAVVIRNLRLGEKVAQPNAMDLPLDLALALLKDSNGVIDLQVPVSGKVSDPQFSYGPVIRKAIFNMITGLVTAPFRLLANLIGGGADEHLDSVRFQPGRSDIAPPEKEKLLKLAEAMGMRPQLALKVPTVVTKQADTLALKTAALDKRIAEALQASAESEKTPLAEQRQHLLETFYQQASLSPTLEEVQAQFTSAETEQSKSQLDVLAYSASLYDKLLAAEVLDSTALQNLGLARQQAVLQFMQDGTGLTAERLQNAEAKENEAKDGWLNMAFEVAVVK